MTQLMNPAPHPVFSAERAATSLVVAWAKNVTVSEGPTPSALEMAGQYVAIRDLILTSPVPPPPSRPAPQPQARPAAPTRVDSVGIGDVGVAGCYL